MTTLQSARKYEELLAGDVEASPYDYTTLFQAKGFFARRRSKKRFKLLKALDVKLRRLLRPGERVYFVTSGSAVTLAEQFFVGWAAYYLNMRALAFTTERILLIQIDGRKKKVKEIVSQISYTALAHVKSTWNGVCQIKLRNGSKFNFQHMPKADRKFLAGLLGDIIQGTPGLDGGRPPGVESLCPHCFVHVPAQPPACTACGGGFKSPKKAALLSLIFPGLGDWYLGHRGFAVFELLGSCLLWFVLIIAPLLAPAAPEAGPLTADYWITAALIIVTAHVIDAMMTRHFALKGHHPENPMPATGGLGLQRG